MEIGMVRESKGVEVAIYEGGIPRGETLMEKAVADHLWGSTWRVKKVTIVGEPVRRRGQWHVDVSYIQPQWKGEDKLLTTDVPTRTILCPWAHFEQVAQSHKDEIVRERAERQAQEESNEKRFAAIEAALLSRGIDVTDVRGDRLMLTFEQVEALLGIGK